MLREDRRSEPRVGERVPYVVVYGSPGLPLIQLVRRSVYTPVSFSFDEHFNVHRSKLRGSTRKGYLCQASVIWKVRDFTS